MIFKAHQWRSGLGTLVRDMRFAQTVAAAFSRRRWRHPWSVAPVWNARTQSWVAAVKTGFVNGQCPIWRTTVVEQENSGQDFGINPLTGKPFFSDNPPFAQAATRTKQIDVPLYLTPAIPLSWRALGFDGVDASAVPRFFLDRGAAEKPQSASGDDEAAVESQTTAEVPRGLRLLRACDLWIHQPRLALTSSIETHPGPVTGISNVSQTLSLRSAAPGDTLRVMSGTLREIAGIDPLARVYEEPAYDELLIATVFLLSPPNAALGSEPDGTWQPFVRHHLFWNLNHVVPWFRQYGGDPAIPFIPPLAAGAATLVTNYLVASINDILQDALNLVTSHSMAGTFYTPTGGGHDAVLPEPAPSATNTGLNKKARLASQATAAARARTQSKLDPDYPFRAEPFDPALLTQTV